ncbi:integrase core domain-containing protein [Vannielia sp.]|uniref:integrase core domain-containing protein n=1 Tax=Vannielia sp. TaxID=2813045 RepID=UPI00345AA1B7
MRRRARSTQLFMRLADAREKLDGCWRRHSNEDRPHVAIRYNAPITLLYPDGATGPLL